MLGPPTRRSYPIAGEEADADMRRCFRHQFRGDIAEAALIEDEEVEPTEVRCDSATVLAAGAAQQ